jgi:hypothetical protein
MRDPRSIRAITYKRSATYEFALPIQLLVVELLPCGSVLKGVEVELRVEQLVAHGGGVDDARLAVGGGLGAGEELRDEEPGEVEVA